MPKRDRDLFHKLRAGGVRKKTAGTLAEAFSRVDKAARPARRAARPSRT